MVAWKKHADVHLGTFAALQKGQKNWRLAGSRHPFVLVVKAQLEENEMLNVLETEHSSQKHYKIIRLVCCKSFENARYLTIRLISNRNREQIWLFL